MSQHTPGSRKYDDKSDRLIVSQKTQLSESVPQVKCNPRALTFYKRKKKLK